MKQNKETTYQRLKRENQELRQKLFILVDAPESEAALSIKADVALCKDIERAIWSGDVTSNQNEGLINLILK